MKVGENSAVIELKTFFMLSPIDIFLLVSVD